MLSAAAANVQTVLTQQPRAHGTELIFRLTSLCMSLGFCCSVLQNMHTSQWPAAQQQHNSGAHTVRGVLECCIL